MQLTLVSFCRSAGQQRSGRPGPAGDRDPELSPQTAPPAGHQTAAPGQYCSTDARPKLTETGKEGVCLFSENHSKLHKCVFYS